MLICLLLGVLAMSALIMSADIFAPFNPSWQVFVKYQRKNTCKTHAQSV